MGSKTGRLIALLGIPGFGFLITGLILLLNSSAAPPFEVPDAPPLVNMEMLHTMGGTKSQLLIYGDCSVYYREDTNLRVSPEFNRTWSTGDLSGGELDELLGFIAESGFGDLESGYHFTGEPVTAGNTPDDVTVGLAGGVRSGDMMLTLAVNMPGLRRVVFASSYLSPDGGMTYPEMPYPLDEVYCRLKDIAENRTEIVLEEVLER